MRTFILGGAIVHIKAFDSTPITHQSQISTEGMGGPYPLSMLGRTLHDNKLCSSMGTCPILSIPSLLTKYSHYQSCTSEADLVSDELTVARAKHVYNTLIFCMGKHNSNFYTTHILRTYVHVRTIQSVDIIQCWFHVDMGQQIEG